MRSLVLLLVLAACPGKQPVDPAHTPAGPKPCEAMADHVVSLMTAGKSNGEDDPASFRELSDKITRVLIDRCTQDKWTIDAQKCFLEIQSFADYDRCVPMLTIAQREAADKAMGDALGPPPAAQPPP